MAKVVTLIGFYSHAHRPEIAEKRVQKSVQLLESRGVKVNYIGCLSDHDHELVVNAGKKISDTVNDSCCIILVYSGWSESTGILDMITDHSHFPLLIWSLAGYREGDKLIAPAAAAGASLLRYSLDRINTKYSCIYDEIDADTGLQKVLDFIHIADCVKRLRHTRIASIGYACSNLYPFMYDGNLIKTETGVQVDNIELMELKILADKVVKSSIGQFMDDFNKNYNPDSRIHKEEIELLSRYYISASEIIEKHNYEGISIKCGSGPGKLLGFTPCMLLSLLGEKINAICEGDIYSLLAQTIVNMLTGLKPTFLEIFEFFNKSVLMASCGFAPFSLCKQDHISIYQHEWGGCGGLMNVSHLKTGEITLFNIFNESGKLKMQTFTGISATPEIFQEEGWDEHQGPMIPSLQIDFDSGLEIFKENIKGPHYIVVNGSHAEIIRKYCYFADIQVESF